MFRYPRYVIKAGEIVVEEGDIRNVHDGPRVHRQADLRREDRGLPAAAVPASYTMSFENYPVELERVHGLQVRGTSRKSRDREGA